MRPRPVCELYTTADLRRVVVGIPRAVAANERHDPSAATTAKRVHVVRTEDITILSMSFFLFLSFFFLFFFFVSFLTRIARNRDGKCVRSRLHASFAPCLSSSSNTSVIIHFKEDPMRESGRDMLCLTTATVIGRPLEIYRERLKREMANLYTQPFSLLLLRLLSACFSFTFA